MSSIERYRKLTGDFKSSDEQVQKKLDYLRAFCRNIIRSELESWVQDQSTRAKKDK